MGPSKRPKGLRQAQSEHLSIDKKLKTSHEQETYEKTSAQTQPEPVYIGDVEDEDDEVGECAALLTAAKIKLSAGDEENALPLFRAVIHECNRLLHVLAAPSQDTVVITTSDDSEVTVLENIASTSPELCVTFATALYYLARHRGEQDEDDERGYLVLALRKLEEAAETVSARKTVSSEEEQRLSQLLLTIHGLQSCIRIHLAMFDAADNVESLVETIQGFMQELPNAPDDERDDVAWWVYSKAAALMAEDDLKRASAYLNVCRLMAKIETRPYARHLRLGLCSLLMACKVMVSEADKCSDDVEPAQATIDAAKHDLDEAVSHLLQAVNADQQLEARALLPLAEAYTNIGTYFEMTDSDEYKTAYATAIKYYEMAVEQDADCNAEEAMLTLRNLID